MKRPNRDAYYRRLGDAMTGGSSNGFWIVLTIGWAIALMASFTGAN